MITHNHYITFVEWAAGVITRHLRPLPPFALDRLRVLRKLKPAVMLHLDGMSSVHDQLRAQGTVTQRDATSVVSTRSAVDHDDTFTPGQ